MFHQKYVANMSLADIRVQGETPGLAGGVLNSFPPRLPHRRSLSYLDKSGAVRRYRYKCEDKRRGLYLMRVQIVVKENGRYCG